MLSFQVVIMALLGGAGRLYGPLLGVVPLVDPAARRSPSTSPTTSTSCSALVFIVIVYFLPSGVIGLADRWRAGGLGRWCRFAPAARRRPLLQVALLEVERLTKTFGGLVAVEQSLD